MNFKYFSNICQQIYKVFPTRFWVKLASTTFYYSSLDYISHTYKRTMSQEFFLPGQQCADTGQAMHEVKESCYFADKMGIIARDPGTHPMTL